MITIPDPDLLLGTPAYEGEPETAWRHLITGAYFGTDADDAPGVLLVIASRDGLTGESCWQPTVRS